MISEGHGFSVCRQCVGLGKRFQTLKFSNEKSFLEMVAHVCDGLDATVGRVSVSFGVDAGGRGLGPALEVGA